MKPSLKNRMLGKPEFRNWGDLVTYIRFKNVFLDQHGNGNQRINQWNLSDWQGSYNNYFSLSAKKVGKETNTVCKSLSA
jgi:hypothetical protein